MATIIADPASPLASPRNRCTVRPGDPGELFVPGDDQGAPGPARARRGSVPGIYDGGTTPEQPGGDVMQRRSNVDVVAPRDAQDSSADSRGPQLGNSAITSCTRNRPG